MGHHARVSITVVIAQSGHGTACRSTPSTVEISVLKASWYAAQVDSGHAK
jgi:hypothetical protein